MTIGELIEKLEAFDPEQDVGRLLCQDCVDGAQGRGCMNNAQEKCPDGHRYRALGNAMPVPVMRWIGRRTQEQEDGRQVS